MTRWSARESVRVLSYVYRTGGTADRFAGALADAARRGLDVRLVLDAWGERKIDDAPIAGMREAGVHVAWFHEFEWRNLRALHGTDLGRSTRIEAGTRTLRRRAVDTFGHVVLLLREQL